MLLLCTLIIFLEITRAVRYGSVKVVCSTTRNSDQYDTSIYKRSRRGHVMINNRVVKCTLDAHTYNSWNPFRDAVKFDLQCQCKIGQNSVHRAQRGKRGFSNGVYEGSFSCDGDKYRVWWAMKFKPRRIGNIVIKSMVTSHSNYACGAAVWQQKLASFFHNLFDLDGQRCCENHDRCYETCGVRKPDCEDDFRNCLTRTCKSQWNCLIAAMLTADITKSDLSNEAFENAQRECKDF